MRGLIPVCALALAIAFIGCSQITAPAKIGLVTKSPVQAELEGVAAAFQAAVIALNREPEDKESLGEFLKQSSEGVHFDSAGRVVLTDGSVVSFKRSFGSCMLFEHGSVTETDYAFSAKEHREEAKISIGATFGDPYQTKEATNSEGHVTR